MRKICSIFCLIIFFTCNHFIFSQDTAKTVFSIKPSTSIVIFPSPTLSYPSPVAGISGSVFINKFEIELGTCWYRKYDLQKAENIGTPQVPVYNYQSVSFIQDYLNIYALMNIKMSQEKRHILSGYFGMAFRKNLSWSSDTLLNNSMHSRNENIQTKAERSVGLSILGGFRYTYICNKTLNLVTGIDAGISIEEEFYAPVGLKPDELIEYPKPYEPKFQLGLSFGLQFMLSKKKGRYFVSR